MFGAKPVRPPNPWAPRNVPVGLQMGPSMNQQQPMPPKKKKPLSGSMGGLR